MIKTEMLTFVNFMVNIIGEEFVMTDFLKLAAGLSAYNDGRYDGYVIGRAEWTLNGDIQNVESSIKKEKKGYLLVEVIGYDAEHSQNGTLVVTMRYSNIFNRKIILQDDGKALTVLHKETFMEKREESFCFCRKKVDIYLKTVGDTNPIHYGAQAIVPGLMLLDFMLDKEIISGNVQNGTIRFLNPIRLNDRFLIQKDNQGLKIVSESGTVEFAKIIL